MNVLFFVETTPDHHVDSMLMFYSKYYGTTFRKIATGTWYIFKKSGTPTAKCIAGGRKSIKHEDALHSAQGNLLLVCLLSPNSSLQR